MQTSIATGLEQVRREMEQAGKLSPYGNKPQLVAVTKTVDVSRIEEAIACGVQAVGENRVQELLEKYAVIGNKVDWHLIGSLQTNKVKYIVDKVAMVHSLDREELAQELQKRCAAIGRTLPVLVQVNLTREESKSGFYEEDVIPFLQKAIAYPNLAIMGLMTIGLPSIDPEETRPVFRRLRELKEEISQLALPGVEMKYLSMGMSHDYPVAITEGANFVRVGSAIFGKRFYP
ncbi:MAG: YggS family pyridoxal phosphate-dependent enzyme [Peptococcaceae bacterium]|nr:YggS family pyridoxal phosphate-dependent enzyme [Peptococcaceae bacterium]